MIQKYWRFGEPIIVKPKQAGTCGRNLLAVVGGARSIIHDAKFPFTCSFLCDGK